MDKKELLKKIILDHKTEINTKQFDKVFRDLKSDEEKIFFLEFILNFTNRNELLELVPSFSASNVDIVNTVKFILQTLDDPDQETGDFIYLESALAESTLSGVAKDANSQKAYISALHLVGIPEIYDVAAGKGYWQRGRDYLIGNGNTALDRWVNLVNLEFFDTDFLEVKDFRRLW